MDSADLATWCVETLPQFYDPGIFDDEEITDDVWAAVQKEISLLTDEEALADTMLDAAADWFRQQRDLEIEALEPLDKDTVQHMITKPQTAQHSADWYAQRRNRLTASEFHQILTGSRERLLRSKVEPAAGDRPAMSPVALAQDDGEMVATSWGHRFEPVVRDIYEIKYAAKICDTLGRFTHRTHEWLSASPDGIVTGGQRTGRLIEIKSPKNRQPGTYVPAEYYVQMQVQMEVCDLDAVDFVEAQFTQHVIFKDGTEREATIPDGWCGQINVYGVLEDPTSWSYQYSRPVVHRADIVPPTSDQPLLESSLWSLKAWFPRTVLRNRTWWNTVGLPEAETFWAQVLSRREMPQVDTIEHVGGWLGSLP
jgi:putative phage-type endonuclease